MRPRALSGSIVKYEVALEGAYLKVSIEGLHDKKFLGWATDVLVTAEQAKTIVAQLEALYEEHVQPTLPFD